MTLVDRKSKLTLIGKVDCYTAEAVEKTLISLMELLPRRNYTLTVILRTEKINRLTKQVLTQLHLGVESAFLWR